jgi:hypothetical protein
MRNRVHWGIIPAERELAKWWQAAPAGQELATVDGDTVRVRYAGRPNPEAGPDFLDAVLETDAGEICGAVELHRRTSDWLRHGHGADPRYAGVVLHVVGRHDGAPSQVVGGRQLPLLEIGSGGEEAGSVAAFGEGVGAGFPCAKRPEHGDLPFGLPAALGRAGDDRFAATVSRLGAALRACGRDAWDQVTYVEIAAALGYSRNSDAMRDLAIAMPLAEARRQSDAFPQDALQIEARLLGSAGLLPSARHLRAAQRRDPYVPALESAWTGFGLPAALRAYRWDSAHARPENSPVRRVVGLAHLVRRWPGAGMMEAVTQCLLSDQTSGTQRNLARLVSVPCPSGYWAHQWDFGRAAKGAAGGELVGARSGETAALVGPSRAADIVVNVLLPLAAAAGTVQGDQALVARAWDCYRTHPVLAENWITRLVRQRARLESSPRGPRGGAEDHVPSARMQQGLIAVFEATCHALQCERCVLHPSAGGV